MFKVIIIGIIITVVGLFTLSVVDTMSQKTGSLINGEPTSEVMDENNVKVAISGEVLHSGSYYISPEETLGTLIDMAGGATEDADPSCYNESILIAAHTSFYIPAISSSSGVCVDTSFTKININVADATDLLEAGFNSSQAPNVVDYRTTNGFYETIEDVLNVKGVGQATFEKVKNKICIQ